MLREKSINTKILLVVILLLLSLPSFILARSVEFTLSSPYWNIEYDRAGYVDITYWHPSPRHPFSAHEMMTGDWAGAVYYDGIGTDSNQAAWLTDEFIVPRIDPTNSPFDFPDPASDFYEVSNSSDNPVWTDANQPSNPPYSAIQNDTGWSKIDDDKLEITIHYEVVDLGEYGWSPLSFIDANESRYVKSERYVILQTYVFKNIHETNDINDFEFYQMLHGHPTGTYPIDTYATYETTLVDDDIADYTPYDTNHQIGNFRYDITLWNDPELANEDHVDYMGFSSTVQPNDVGFNYFTSGSTGMAEDVIENRNLNGRNSWYDDDMAGAMMWNLPDLSPGESTSITLALMYGTENIPYPTILTKANADPNNECVRPFIGMGIDGNYLTYDICYDTNGYALDDVNIIDYLPIEVDYYSSTPAGDYNSIDRTVTWSIGNLSTSDSNCIELVTKVNYYAKPGGKISNFVQIQSTEGITAYATSDINLCNWGGEIIYVDQDANGLDNGTSWYDAYTDLQDAFIGAQNLAGSVTAIWVAEGIYQPTYDINDSDYKNKSFELVGDVGLFGHFAGNESLTSQRDFADANNTTILEGKIGAIDTDAVEDVVKATDVNDAVVDGFTIRGAYGDSGIYLDSSDVAIVNCKIKDNYYGIGTTSSSFDIHNCFFMNNTSAGIRSHVSQADISYCTFDGNSITSKGLDSISSSTANISKSVILNHTGDGIYSSSAPLQITNCIIENNGGDGIYSSYRSPIIKNSIIRNNEDHGMYINGTDSSVEPIIINNWIHNNGTDGSGSGLYLRSMDSVATVRNNTIFNNDDYGIYLTDTVPDINNCIIWGNGTSLYNITALNYCNVNSLAGITGIGNITSDPCFVDADANNFHLSETSQCKDGGDPNGSYDESDIDGENRVYYSRVDIGADEYYWSAADIDEDELVDFADYAIFAKAWQSNSGDGNYDEDCDLEDNNSIDVNDLVLFCEDWLWEKAGDEGWMMAMDSSGGSTLKSMSMMLESSFLSIELPSVAPSVETSSDNLLLSVTESIDSRPERLKAKSQKFYDITPATVAESKIIQSVPTTRELYEIQAKLLKWLDEMWDNGEFDKTMSEKEYLEFRKSIEELIGF